MNTSTEQHYEIIVLGAGAAGLMCAITAANRGRRVLVLEKSNKPGKKILMSGGGRCNFTNLYVEPENYISENPHFCKSALSSYSQWDFISLVEENQIPHLERKHGQLFCRDSAKEILAMLLDLCRKAGVEIHNRVEVSEVNPISRNLTERESAVHRYKIKTETNIFICDSLIVATGALSIPTLGGSALGYELAKQLSLKMTDLSAGLVPLTFTDSIKGCCERLSGISLQVEITTGEHAFTEDLLFTHRGISGPVVLQISNYWQPGAHISIDLLPLIDSSNWLLDAKTNMASSLLRTVLAQILPRALVLELQAIWWQAEAEQPLAGISDRRLTEIGRMLHYWRLKPSGTEGYRTAEVTLGGVSTDELNAKTMEAKNHPGLFFIGEVVDVSGHLGGFNFQWAWSSGFIAGSVA